MKSGVRQFVHDGLILAAVIGFMALSLLTAAMVIRSVDTRGLPPQKGSPWGAADAPGL